MSISVDYHSFSPSRADRGWDEEGDKIIRDLHELYTVPTLEYAEEDSIQNEVDSLHKLEKDQLMTSLRERFKGTTLDYEWESIEEVVDFLNLDEKKHYEEILSAQTKLYSEKKRELLEQKKLVTQRKQVPREEILTELCISDLMLGSVSTDSALVFMEEAWIEDWCMKSLCETFLLPTIDDVPTKEGWIKLFEELEIAKLELAIQTLCVNVEIDPSFAKEAMLSYLAEIKPVIVDLKETNDAIFSRQYDDGGSDPKPAEELLQKRALMLLDRYKDNLPETF